MSGHDILGSDLVWVMTWRLCRDMAQLGRDRVGTIGAGRGATTLWARA